MEIVINDKNNLKIINIIGEFMIQSLPLFQEKVFPLLKDDKVKTISFDLKELSHIDSSGIGKLVQALNLAKNNSKEFILFNVNDHVLNLFKSVKLDGFFKILSYNDFERKYLR